MLITTTSTIQNRTITDYLGVVSGETIIGANVIKDIFATIRDVVGGRSSTYERVLKEAREQANAEMVEQARVLGADAIIGVDYDFETVGQAGSMLMVAVSGTAIRLA